MDWIRDNKFLAGYVAVFVVVGGLLAFLMVSARSGYNKTIEEYASTSKMVDGLSNKDLYPDKETLELVQEEAGKMRKAVDKLQNQMLEFNRPLNVTMTGGGFQQKLTQRVVGLKKRSVLEGVQLEEDFSLGLNRYTAELPNEKAVPDLDFHLDALDYLANALFDAGIDSIDVFDRIPLAVEGNAGDAAKGKRQGNDDDEEEVESLIRRYPVRICFKGRPGTLETFVNGISNAPKEDFFFNTRYVTIKNETDEGPEKGIEFDVGVRSSEGIEPEETDDSSSANEPVDEAGVVDSRVVLGNEKIEACLVIEAIRVEPIPDPDSDDGADDE